MLSGGHWQPDEDGSYFIDRNPKNFGIILEYLRTGQVPVITGWSPTDIMNFQKDLDYFQIKTLVMRKRKKSEEVEVPKKKRKPNVTKPFASRKSVEEMMEGMSYWYL